MVVKISNSKETAQITLNSATVCGYTDTKNILIFRLRDEEEITDKVGEFEHFVGSQINVTLDDKMTFTLTPTEVKYNERSICYEFPAGGLSWN